VSRSKASQSRSSASASVTRPPIPLGRLLLWMTAGALLVLGARARSEGTLHLSDVLPVLLWAVSAAGVVVGLRLGRFRGSGALAGGVLFLSGVGVLVQTRMNTYGGTESLGLWIQPVGFLWLLMAWAFSRKGRVEWLMPFRGLAFLLSLAVVAGVVALGSRFRGAMYGPGGMTPTELLKLLIPFSLAGFFAAGASRWKGRSFLRPPFRETALLLIGWGMLCALLILQKDLGLIVLLSGSLLILLICATGSWSWAVPAAAAAGAGGWLISEFLSHGARRFEAWLDPFADPTGSGWQVLQGLSGLYAGGVSGTGLGEGAPERLPIAGSDFVYAVIGEELGYLGCLLVLGLYAVILRRTARTADRQTERFSFLFAAGLTAALAVQVIVNIAGVVTLLPVTGITLPYISQGGSSYWVTSVQFGLLLGLSEPREPTGRKAGKKGKGKRKA